jgi:hypothetical protein
VQALSYAKRLNWRQRHENHLLSGTTALNSPTKQKPRKTCGADVSMLFGCLQPSEAREENLFYFEQATVV